MVIVAQKADVDIEVLDQVSQHSLTRLGSGGRVDPHQLGCD
jgi:hypothetical protein